VRRSDKDDTAFSQKFSQDVDELLKGATAEECCALDEAYRSDLAFAERLIKAKPRPRATFEAGLKRHLLERMSRSSAGHSKLVMRGWRLGLSGLLVGGLMLVILWAWMPAAAALAVRPLQDGVVRVLRYIGVREVTQRSAPSPVKGGEAVQTYEIIAEVQPMVSFSIRVPAYLPRGFRLEGIQVLEPSTVALNYRLDPKGEEQGVELLSLVEHRLSSQRLFEVGEGSSKEIMLNGKPAILVTGRGWARGGVRWQRGEGYLVIWEADGLAFSLLSTLSREETLRVAESIR